MGKYKRLGKNTLLVFIGNLGSKLIGLLMLPFYTKWLSVEDYGVSDMISVYARLLSYIVTCCIAESIFVFPKNASENEKKKYFTSGLFFEFIMFAFTGIIFVIIRYITKEYGIKNTFIDNIFLIYFMLLSSSLQAISQQFARSIDKLRVYSFTGVIVTVCTVLFAFLMIPKWGVLGYVYSIMCAYVVGAVYSMLLSGAFKYVGIKYVSKEYCKKMLVYSIPLIPNGVMWWLVNSLNRPIMEEYLGLNSIGVYAVAGKFPSIISMVFSVFAISWQISVLEEYGKDSYQTFYNKILRFIILLLTFVFLILTILSKPLVHIFSTENFYEAWQYIPLMTFGVMFSNLSGFCGSTFSAVKQSKYFFYSSLWGALTALIGNFIFIPWVGIWGCAISTALSFFVMTIARILYSLRYVRITNGYMYIIMMLLNLGFIILHHYVSSYIILAFSAFVILTIDCLMSKKHLIFILNMVQEKSLSDLLKK